MARQTEKYRRSFAGSVGAGIGSLVNASGRTYYILEHKVTTKYHRAGESQKIIVDQIELGRDSSCQIRFDENFGTVSRRHAAIVRDGGNWKLIQLSTTNSTLLNGRPVTKEWYLQSGDEIQLSVNGPKMGFIIPQGKQGLTSSIRLTERLNLFRQQALRPYKRSIAVLSIILVLAVGGLGAWNYALNSNLKEQSVYLSEAIKMAEGNAQKSDSLANELVENNKKMANYEEQMIKLRDNAAAAWKAAQEANKKVENIGGVAPGEIQKCYPNVYFIAVMINNIKYSDGNSPIFLGTGFLLNDGRFVTARHVVDLWNTVDYRIGDNKKKVIVEGLSTFLNSMAHNGKPLEISFLAKSPSGDEISFEYRSDNHPFTFGNSPTEVGSYSDESGMNLVYKHANWYNHTDWASIQMNKNGGLNYDSSLSKNLPAKQRLDILGFPRARGAENLKEIKPIYSESTVARDGLDVNGTIMLSNEDTQGGNSGGPVMVYKDGKYNVVGILTGSTAGKDRVVPISAID
jgi:V8-like Glu-specific endopeptidase